MKHLRFVLILSGALALPLRAQPQLAPVGDLPLPIGHSYILNTTFIAYADYPNPEVLIATIGETYAAQLAYSAGTVSLLVTGAGTWQKIYDLSGLGLFLNEQSIVVRDPTTPSDFYVTGGLVQNHVIAFEPPATLFSNTVIGDLQSLPTGVVLRSPTSANAPVSAFFSSNGRDGNGDLTLTPALYYQPDARSAPWTTTNAFGTSGPGQVSTGVGALAFGPDGLLNVIDTGTNRILRYNPDTLAFVSSFSLANTTTTNHSFAITANGYVFTANVSGGGDIYNYVTGALVATYAGHTQLEDPRSRGGATSLTVDSFGYVYVNEFGTAGDGLYVFDSNQLSAIPEPATYAAILGFGALGLATMRRRRSA